METISKYPITDSLVQKVAHTEGEWAGAERGCKSFDFAGLDSEFEVAAKGPTKAIFGMSVALNMVKTNRSQLRILGEVNAMGPTANASDGSQFRIVGEVNPMRPTANASNRPRFRIRSSLQKTRQEIFSIPRYLSELARIRRPSELYWWAQFKCPNLFPVRDVPTYVTVEVTNFCNLSCHHCWRATMHRPVGSMEVAVFEKIVRELSVLKPTEFKLGGSGEPAVHPKFRELMNLLPGYGLRVVVYTDGFLLRRFAPDEILSWGLDTIVVSVDGLDAATYEQIKIGSNYASLCGLITDFYNYRKSSGRKSPIIDIRHILMRHETANQIRKFRSHWLQTADVVSFNYLEPLGGLSEVEDPSPPKCRQIRRELSIQWDGRVPLCGGYRREWIGSVRESTIAELWRHPRLEFLRQCNERRAFSQVPLCKRCLHCR